MDVLIVGGNRFVGNLLAWRLCAQGHRVCLFSRGRLDDHLGDRVERARGDRTTGALSAFLAGRARPFDATVDFAAFRRADVAELAPLAARVGHYVFISSGQVYLVRSPAPAPARESDYEGPLLPRPTSEPELGEWTYGVEKREAEDWLAGPGAQAGLRATRLRIPMVNGERDYHRRVEGYLWRLLDGRPLLLPAGDRATRHVYAPEVVRVITQLLGQEEHQGQAYNLAQREVARLSQILEWLGEEVGARPRLVEVPAARVLAAGLEPTAVSPFSGRWMSNLDPGLAEARLGFVHRPVREYLRSIVQSFLAHPPADPPEGYRRRAEELALL